MADQMNKIIELPLSGAFLIKTLSFPDPRGSFHVMLTQPTLQKAGVKFEIKMEFLSISKKGVLRGLHYQAGAHAQAKLVTCVKGEAYDVLVDLRKSSPTFGKWTGVRLSERDGPTVYVPRGFAHGYMALSDETQIHYMVDNMYAPAAERGVRFDDPTLKIAWPKVVGPTCSERDMKWPGINSCEKFE